MRNKIYVTEEKVMNFLSLNLPANVKPDDISDLAKEVFVKMKSIEKRLRQRKDYAK